MRATVANRAVAFHLAVRAGVAHRAVLFQLAMWALVAHRAAVFLLPVRAPFSQAYGAPLKTPPLNPAAALTSSPTASRVVRPAGEMRKSDINIFPKPRDEKNDTSFLVAPRDGTSMHVTFVRASRALVPGVSAAHPTRALAISRGSVVTRATTPVPRHRVLRLGVRRALAFTAAAALAVTLAPRPGLASSLPFVSAGTGSDPSGCAPVASDYSPVRTFATKSDPGDMDSTLAQYPGTALTRMENARSRAASLTEQELSTDWETVRGKLLWAAGLRDLKDVPPGQGNTGHCFNDFNHVDATTMVLDVSDNENRGQVSGIAFGNRLGPGIRVASDPELGPGGTWGTCAQGGASEPPADVAHVQFQSKIAWKLVWVPGKDTSFSRFILVDDEGVELASGVPTGNVPNAREREYNFQMLKGGRYAKAAEARA